MDWAVLIGVGGTLAGTALGGVFGYTADRTRWRRDQEARWTDERRTLYAQVIAECEYIVEDATANLLDKERPTIGDIMSELRPARERFRRLIADLELIGTEDDADAARQLSNAATKLLNKSVSNPQALAKPIWDEWNAALAAFKRQARAGLHLTPPVSLSVSLRRRLQAGRGIPGGRHSA